MNGSTYIFDSFGHRVLDWLGLGPKVANFKSQAPEPEVRSASDGTGRDARSSDSGGQRERARSRRLVKAAWRESERRGLTEPPSQDPERAKKRITTAQFLARELTSSSTS